MASDSQNGHVGTVKDRRTYCTYEQWNKLVLLIKVSGWSVSIFAWFEPRHEKTNKWTMGPAKTQISLGVRPVWSESLLCAQWVVKDPNFLHVDSEVSDQTRRMPRLIWGFAGRILILLVLSWDGSFINSIEYDKQDCEVSWFYPIEYGSRVMVSDLHGQSWPRMNVQCDVQADQFQYFCPDIPACTKFSVSLNLLYSVYWVSGDFFIRFKSYGLRIISVFTVSIETYMYH